MLSGMVSSVSSVSKGHSGQGSLSNVYVDPNDNNFGIGENLTFHASAENNISIGADALNSSGADCDYNIGIGTNALTAVSTGDNNIGIGYNAGGGLTDVTDNVAIGHNALADANGATYNIAIGSNALKNNTGVQNVAVGKDAGTALAAGVSNTIVGYLGGKGLAGNNYNSIFGNQTLNNSSAAINGSVAIGYAAMQGDLSTVADNTVAIGHSALQQLEAGAGNIAIGYQAMLTHVDGNRNIAIGYASMNNTDADSASENSNDNVFLGYKAGGGTWGLGESSHNIGIGSYALIGSLQNSTGNVAIGQEALNDLSTGDYNTCIGFNSGDKLTGNSKNTAVGAHTLGDDSADYNVAIGFEAGKACNDDSNVYVGYQAGDVNTGTKTIVIGAQALGSGVDVDEVVAIGYHALSAANDDANHGTIAIGTNAGRKIAATGSAYGGGNTLIGYEVGYDSGAETGLTTGTHNTALGFEAFGANAGAALTGSYNTVMGYRAGYSQTGASHGNTLLGYRAGNAITTGDYNIVIGYDADCTATDTKQIAIGYNLTTNADSQVRIGNSSYYTSLDASQASQSWAATSDVRIKKDIENTDLGLNFIKLLRPVKYREKPTSEFPKEFKVKNPSDKTVDMIHDGLIAQEVKEAADSLNSTFSGWSEDADTRQELQYGKFITPLIKAVQELSQQIEDLKKG